jgi:hypothetical protein
MGLERDLELLRDIKTTASQLVMSVTNAIDSTAYDLNAAAFSEVTNVSNDYILDSVELNFSTAEAKTITITSADGTILWGGDVDQTAANQGYLSTAKNIYLEFNRGFNGGENITVEVTQFGSAGTMDCVLKTRSGTNTLVGDPDVRIVDSVGNVYEDAIRSKCLPTIDIDHFFTHAGATFTCSDTITIAQSSTKYFHLKVANNPIHLIHYEFVSTQADLDILLFENPTTSADGDACTVYNRNRGSSNVAEIEVYEDPTVGADGTQLEHDQVTGGKQAGGGTFDEGGQEWILKANEQYLIKIINSSNQDDEVSYKISVLEPAQV